MLRERCGAKLADEILGDRPQVGLRHCQYVALPLLPHTSWQVCGLVHGDDFVFMGKVEHHKAISKHIAGNFTVKDALIGPKATGVLRPLNRSI